MVEPHKQEYPLPEGIDAIVLADSFKFSKDHLHINEKYRVQSIPHDSLGLH